MFQMVMRNFDAESHDGTPWVPLAPSTVRQKAKQGYSRILQNTGQLRQSFLPFSDNDYSGVGSLRTKRHADLSEIHEFGKGHVPRRPMLPAKNLVLREAVKIYQFFLTRRAAA